MPIKDKYYAGWLEKLPASFEGKTVAITGTTSGTGYWASIAVIRKGATALLVLNRESERSQASLEALKAEKEKVQSKTEIIPIKCNLKSFESVKQAAAEVNKTCEKFNGLNVLLNNAGISLATDDRTEDGYEVQMQVNHLSHFLLTKLVMPALVEAYENGEEVRICQHSSGGRNNFGGNLEGKYFEKNEKGSLGGNSSGARLCRYHMTKLSNIMFGFMLNRKLAEKGYDVARFKSVAAEPGYADTNLISSATKNHGSLVVNSMAGVYNAVIKHMIGAQSPADGSLSVLQACFGEEVESGDYFMPEKINYGNPMKAFSKGEINEGYKGKEKMCLDEQNYNVVWEKSEEACGAFFES